MKIPRSLTPLVTCALAIALSNLLMGQTHPSVPQTIAYQGRISAPGQAAVPDGEYVFTFRILDAASNGNLLWSETRPEVEVSSGRYRVDLGAVTPIPLSALNRGDAWLEVLVEGQSLALRSRIVSVPFALRAEGEVPESAILLSELSGDATITGMGYTQQGETIGSYYLYRKDAYNPAQPRVPQRIAYQGRVLPLNGGTVGSSANFTFTIYDSDTLGAALWTETQNNLPVSHGRFSAELGSVNPIYPAHLTPKDLWLSVRVNGEAMRPREKLSSTAYALKVVSPVPEGGIVLSVANINPALSGKKFSPLGASLDGYYLFKKDAFAAGDSSTPLLINYQGRLTDNTGKPLASNIVDLGFSIYSVPAGGTPLWSETVTNVVLDHAIYNVFLGAGSVIAPDTFTSADAYLAVSVVQGATVQTLSPRQRLTSVPFALQAEGTMPTTTIILAAGANDPRLLNAGFMMTGDTVDGYYLYSKVDVVAPPSLIVSPAELNDGGSVKMTAMDSLDGDVSQSANTNWSVLFGPCTVNNVSPNKGKVSSGEFCSDTACVIQAEYNPGAVRSGQGAVNVVNDETVVAYQDDLVCNPVYDGEGIDCSGANDYYADGCLAGPSSCVPACTLGCAVNPFTDEGCADSRYEAACGTATSSETNVVDNEVADAVALDCRGVNDGEAIDCTPYCASLTDGCSRACTCTPVCNQGCTGNVTNELCLPTLTGNYKAICVEAYGTGGDLTNVVTNNETLATVNVTPEGPIGIANGATINFSCTATYADTCSRSCNSALIDQAGCGSLAGTLYTGAGLPCTDLVSAAFDGGTDSESVSGTNCVLTVSPGAGAVNDQNDLKMVATDTCDGNSLAGVEWLVISGPCTINATTGLLHAPEACADYSCMVQAIYSARSDTAPVNVIDNETGRFDAIDLVCDPVVPGNPIDCAGTRISSIDGCSRGPSTCSPVCTSLNCTGNIVNDGGSNGFYNAMCVESGVLDDLWLPTGGADDFEDRDLKEYTLVDGDMDGYYPYILATNGQAGASGYGLYIGDHGNVMNAMGDAAIAMINTSGRTDITLSGLIWTCASDTGEYVEAQFTCNNGGSWTTVAHAEWTGGGSACPGDVRTINQNLASMNSCVNNNPQFGIRIISPSGKNMNNELFGADNLLVSGRATVYGAGIGIVIVE